MSLRRTPPVVPGQPTDDQLERTHGPRIEGQWWAAASTPDGTARARIDMGGAEFTVLPDGRLDFQVSLAHTDGRKTTVKGVAVSEADSRGVYRWTGKGFVRFVTWFRWNYRFAAEGRLLVVGHPGSVVSQPTYLIFARRGMTELEARSALDTAGESLGFSPRELSELARYRLPTTLPGW